MIAPLIIAAVRLGICLVACIYYTAREQAAKAEAAKQQQAAAASQAVSSGAVASVPSAPIIDQAETCRRATVQDLVAAAHDGDCERLRVVLAAGVPVDAVLPNERVEGYTAAYAAVFAGNLQALKLLVEKGANINHTFTAICIDGQRTAGATMLMAASVKGHANIIRYLIQCGAIVNARTARGSADGDSALMSAAYAGEAACTRLLLEEHARGSLRSAASQPVASASAVGATAASGPAAEPYLPPAQSAPVMAAAAAATAAAPTPLAVAAEANRAFQCRQILGHGADVNERFGTTLPDGRTVVHGATALMAAARAGNSVVVGLLLERGADANAKRSDGAAALHLAAQSGHLGEEEALVQASDLARGMRAFAHRPAPFVAGVPPASSAHCPFLPHPPQTRSASCWTRERRWTQPPLAAALPCCWPARAAAATRPRWRHCWPAAPTPTLPPRRALRPFLQPALLARRAW